MKKSEKILLSLFALTLLVIGGGIGFDQWRKTKASVIEEKWNLELQLAEIETLIEEADLWQNRSQWLQAHQPVYSTRDTIDNHIFQTVKHPVGNVSIGNIKLIEGKQSDHWVQAGARVVATGTMPEVFGWLHQLQSPKNFYVIENLKVIPDKKSLDVIQCEFELIRWYAPKPATVVTR